MAGGRLAGCHRAGDLGACLNQRKSAEALLQATRLTQPGEAFTTAGQTLTRRVIKDVSEKVGADDPATGERRDLDHDEDHAFWDGPLWRVRNSVR